ncbi:uncharacterized protein LOC108740311 [Agrilus planipennis]|uniref:Uncharacterized protein LOC108740311 n=1 Tax=Agrilus planipennis TaxID=224129 RepID=A0A1W4X1T9_AGRPL|nr:uncharacterized protein LOC108740311 [Agrilus planipennis]
MSTQKPGDCTDEEKWIIKNLPFEWDCVCTKSKVLKRMLQRREKNHMSAIEIMKAKLIEVNCFIDNHIRRIGEDLKETVSMAKSKASDICENFEKNLEQSEIGKISHDELAEAADDLMKLEIYSNESIENFHSYLKCLENLRSERYKVIFQEAYLNLHIIQHLSPMDIEGYFEKEIINMNELIMNNFRLYSELHSKLRLQNEHAFLICSRRMNAFKEIWRNARKKVFMNHITTSLCSLSKVWDEEFQKDAKAKNVSVALEDTGKSLTNLLDQKITLPTKSLDLNKWLNDMQSAMDYMDGYSMTLIGLYKNAISKVFHGYIDRLGEIKHAMMSEGVIDITDLHTIDAEIIKMSDEIGTSDQIRDAAIFEKNWHVFSDLLKKKLEKPYQFLRKSASLWDLHLSRIEEAKVLIHKELQNIIDKNDETIMLFETGVNTALDALRQQHTENDLKAALGEVFIVLDKIKKKYLTNHEAEVKVLNKFTKLSETATGILTAELQLFLKTFPKENIYIHKSNSVEYFPSNEGIFQNINVIVHKVNAVENWMTGLRETIETYSSNCKEELSNQTSDWIEQETKKLAERLEVQLCFHESRYERIKINVYDQRLNEIRSHEEALNKHKAGVDEVFLNLKKDITNYYVEMQKMIKNFHENLGKMKEKINECKSESAMKCLISELTVAKQKCLNEIQDKREAIEKNQISKINTLKQAGSTFANSIKLFSEDGNFSPPEAKRYLKALAALEKVMKKKHVQLVKDLNLKRAKAMEVVMKTGNDAVTPFLNVLEEFVYADAIQNSIEKVKDEIKDTAVSLKSLVKLKQAEFFNIKDTAFATLELAGGHEILADKLEQLLNNLRDLCQLLEHPQAVTNDYGKYFKNIETPKSATSTISSRSRSKSSESAFPMSKKLIATSPKPNDNSIMGRFCAFITQTFQKMVEKSQKYYHSSTNVKNTNVIKPNFAEQMAELIPRLNYYYLQCEGFWLEQTNSLFEIFNDVQSFLISIDTQFLKKMHMEFQQNFDLIQQNTVKEVKGLLTENIANVRKIHDKLRPLHGYVSNNKLLEELKNEYYETCTNSIVTIECLPEPYDVQINEMVKNYEEDLITVNENLQLLKLFLNEFATLIIPIVPQFEKILDNIVRFINEDSISEVDSESRMKIQFYKESIPIPSNYSLNLNNSKIILKELSNNTGNLSYITGSFESPVEQFDVNVENFIQISQDNAKVLIEKLITMKDSSLVTIEEDKKRFNFDVQTVINLYALRYDAGDQPEEPAEKPKGKKKKK